MVEELETSIEVTEDERVVAIVHGYERSAKAVEDMKYAIKAEAVPKPPASSRLAVMVMGLLATQAFVPVKGASKPKPLAGRYAGPVKSKQINAGRNDPCPCGSGKKFKKCCLP